MTEQRQRKPRWKRSLDRVGRGARNALQILREGRMSSDSIFKCLSIFD